MARPLSVPGGRNTVIGTRLSTQEVAFVDSVRGALSRSEYLRWLVLQDRKRRTRRD